MILSKYTNAPPQKPTIQSTNSFWILRRHKCQIISQHILKQIIQFLFTVTKFELGHLTFAQDLTYRGQMYVISLLRQKHTRGKTAFPTLIPLLQKIKNEKSILISLLFRGAAALIRGKVFDQATEGRIVFKPIAVNFCNLIPDGRIFVIGNANIKSFIYTAIER